MKRFLSFVIAMVMILSLFPAMIITSSAEDAVDYQHVTVRTENVTPYPQMMKAGETLDVVGGTNPIDAGAENNVRPTDKGVGGSAHDSYGTAWNNGVGTVAMRSANTWLYGYVIKVEGLTSAAQANVYAQGWGHNGPAGAGTTGGGYNMEYKDAKYNIPGDGVYAILMNGQVFGGSMNADRVAVAFVQKMQLTLDKDATVTFLGEIEAAVEDLSADSFSNTLPINYMVNGAIETVEYPITDGLSKGQYVKSQDAVAIPALDKKLDSVVDDSTKSTHIGWASTEDAAEADVAYAITEKGILDAIYPVYFTVPNIAAPALQDGWFGEGDVVRIPNTETESIPNTGYRVWEGNAEFKTASKAFTFVFRASGIVDPVVATKVNPYYTLDTGSATNWNNAPDKWEWNNIWSSNPGIFAPEMTIAEDGVYYLYLNDKVLTNGRNQLIQSVQGFNIFDTQGNVRTNARSNTNDNATFEMLAIVPCDLQPTVTFYDESGNELGKVTEKYTEIGNNGAGDNVAIEGDSINFKKAKQFHPVMTAEEAFAQIQDAVAPTKEFDGTYNYRLVWVDENRQPVDGIYKSMNIYAYFEPVAANQMSVTFVDVSDKTISTDYVEKGSTAEFTGVNPSIDTTATTEYVFTGWATEKGGEAVDLETYAINEDTTFYPVFIEKKLPVITLFENPVSTTFGTRANLLPDGFTATVSGLTGYTLLLKIDGIPYGETAKWGGIRPIVHAADGSNKDPIWNGNWVTDAYKTNSYMFEANGYYLYYFPFKSVANELGSEKTVAGVSALNSFTVFDKSGALGWNSAAETTKDERITVTLVGMVEGNVTPFNVEAKNGNDVLATQKTTASINMLSSANNAGWAKLDTGFDLFGDRLGCTSTSYIKRWTNENGDENKYILTETVVRPVIEEGSVLLTVEAASETAYGSKAYEVNVTLGAENVDSASIILEYNKVFSYNKGVFTNPRLADGTKLEECPEGAILNLTGTNTAKVLFDISENAADRTYSFNAYGTCVVDGASAPAKTMSALSIKVKGQQVGGYFTEGENRVTIYQTNENNAAVDAEGKEVDEQKVWKGNVDFDGQKDTVTFVFKVDGVESDINATRIHFNTNNGGLWRTSSWSQWREYWGADADKTNGFASALTFKASDGATYYYLTLGRRYINNDGTMYGSMQGFTLFKKDPDNKTTKLIRDADGYKEIQAALNENEDAGFEMLAVIGGNLAPKVEFYDDTAVNGGKLIGEPRTYEYPKAVGYQDGTGSNTAMKKYGTLVTVAEVFAASGYAAPVKASTEDAAYEFIGWVDENGNDITNAPVYKAQRIYANYKTIETVEKYTVTFMNDDEEFGTCSGILYNAYATAPEGTPVRADIPTGGYTFKGWSLEKDGEVIDLETYPIIDNLKLYASYEYKDVTYTVTYMNGEEKFYEETVVRSKNAAFTGVPKYATDAYKTNEEGEVEDAYYHRFVNWVDTDGNAADFTNIQGNITVKAAVEDIPVTIWHTVTWHDDNGAVLATAMVADGDGVTAPSNIKGSKNGTADENVWYTFSGWDKSTAVVTADVDAYPAYTETPVATTPIEITGNKVSGKVGEPHVMFNGKLDLSANPIVAIAIIVDIQGASPANSVVIGSIKADANGNTSNNVGNMPDKNVSNPKTKFTSEGKYIVLIGASTMFNGTYNGQYVIGELTHVGLDDPSSTRGYTTVDASGEATYTSYLIAGDFNPEVRFYDEEEKWLYTGKYTYDTWHSMVEAYSLPSPASLYKGADLGENFLYWGDKDGNEITQVYDNMDVYAVYKHVHTYENAVAVGAGVIACTDPKCDGSEGAAISAATVTAGDMAIKAPKAGETFTVPVVITNNPGVVGITLSVETSENVSLTGASVDDTLYEGAVMTQETKIVLNRGENAEGNLTEDGTIVYLTLKALETMNEGDTFTVKVSVTDTAADSDEGIYKPVLYSDYTNEYTVIARDPEIEFDKLSFTVGNKMSFNVNVKFTPNSADFDTDKAKLTVEMLDENSEYVVLGEDSVIAEKDADGTYDMSFTISGIPMAYLANSLKVRFVTVDAENELEAEEDEMINVQGKPVAISFGNYSEYLKAEGGNPTLSNLLDTMLNYTAAVQQYMGYKTDDLANEGIENNIKSINEYSDADWSKYTAMVRKVTSKADATVKFTGSKLLMSSDKTGFRFVFEVGEGVDLTSLNLVVKCNDDVVARVSGSSFVKQDDGKYHADFDGYAPEEFDTQIKVAIFNGNERVSNIAYDSIPGVAKDIANNNRYARLCPVLSGMLAYCDAVKTYVASTKN